MSALERTATSGFALSVTSATRDHAVKRLPMSDPRNGNVIEARLSF